MTRRRSCSRPLLVLVAAALACRSGDDGGGDGSTGAESSGSASSTSTSTSASGTGDADSSTSADTGASTETGVVEPPCGGAPVVVPGFATPQASPGLGRIVAVADVDADGILDAVLIEPAVAASIVLGTAGGGWGATVDIPGGPWIGLAVAKLDADDTLDFAAFTDGPFALSTYVGVGDGTFTAYDQPAVNVPIVGIDIATLDVDADLDNDLFVSGDGNCLLARNDAGFPASSPIGVDNASLFLGDLAVGDLDGATGDDVLVHGRVALFADGMGSLAFGTTLASVGGQAAIAQLDDAAFADVALAEFTDAPAGSASMRVALTTDQGLRGLDDVLPACVDCIRDKPTAADVNDDAVLDLVYPSQGGIGILLGCGDGTFADPVELSSDVAVRRVAVADLDGDGLADLVTTTADPPAELVVALQEP